jgi:hypothetical protein
MPGWIIAAGLGSVAVTALLTWVLWRINAPLRESDEGEPSGPSKESSASAE